MLESQLRATHLKRFAAMLVSAGDLETSIRTAKLRVTQFMFFKIKAHVKDSLQGLLWSKLTSGHVFMRGGQEAAGAFCTGRV